MNIHLNVIETHYIMKLAEEYKTKTGDDYSVRFICALLEERYADRLQDDLKEVLNEKIKLYEQNVKKKS